MSSRSPLPPLAGLASPAIAPTPVPGGVRVESLEAGAGPLTIVAAASRPSAACPLCGRRSRREQSRSVRTLSDRPVPRVLGVDDLAWRRGRVPVDRAAPAPSATAS
jgi:hypothetical protein